MEILSVGAPSGSSSPLSFIQSANLTELVIETTFVNRSLISYFCGLDSGTICGTLTYYDFVTSIKYFRQNNSSFVASNHTGLLLHQGYHIPFSEVNIFFSFPFALMYSFCRSIVISGFRADLVFPGYFSNLNEMCLEEMILYKILLFLQYFFV